MKIALAQINVLTNQPERNLETHLRMIEEAKRRGADLVAFPEMSLCGYFLGDLFLRDAYCRDLMRFNDRLREASHGIAIAWGNICLDDGLNARVGDTRWHPNKDGRVRRYNAIYIAQNGQWARRAAEHMLLPPGVAIKTLLPDYRAFRDPRYFFSLKDVSDDFGVSLETLAQPFLIETAQGPNPVGFELCEDLWCQDYRLRLAPLDMTKLLVRNGANLIVNLSCSNWTYGKNDARDRRVLEIKAGCGDAFVPFLYVNNVGAQNNGKNILVMDGGTTAYNAQGQPVQFAAKAYAEELMVVDRFDGPPLPRQRRSKVEEYFEGLLAGLDHVKAMAGRTDSPRWLVGLSGGIDSAVVAALLTLVDGPDHVMAVNLPTAYNSEQTQTLARGIAESLRVRYTVVPIGAQAEAERRLLEATTGQPLSAKAVGNLMAKIRMTILSTMAEHYGALFTCNANKWEISRGYFTLDGDGRGAIMPLADLTKADVYALGRYLNTQVFKREVLPETLFPNRLGLFDKGCLAPTAELETNQQDPIKIHYHCALIEQFMDFRVKTTEDILGWYLEGTLHHRLGLPLDILEVHRLTDPPIFVKDLEEFAAACDWAAFKRVQGAAIIDLTKTAWGYDRLESILPCRVTARHKELREQVLRRPAYQPRTPVTA